MKIGHTSSNNYSVTSLSLAEKTKAKLRDQVQQIRSNQDSFNEGGNGEESPSFAKADCGWILGNSNETSSISHI